MHRVGADLSAIAFFTNISRINPLLHKPEHLTISVNHWL